jgi:hypothetical protein
MSYDSTVLRTSAGLTFMGAQGTSLPSEQALERSFDNFDRAVKARQRERETQHYEQLQRDKVRAMVELTNRLTHQSAPEDPAIGEALNDRLFDLL